MVAIPENFNAENVDPLIGFEPLPAGEYLAKIITSEQKETKSHNGWYLELTFEIVSDQCKGRKLWARLNLQNPNPKAVQMAQAELSSICRAVGIMQPQDSAQLHEIPITITVVQKTMDNGNETNEIKGYKKRDMGIPTTPRPQAPVSQVAAADQSSPPWGRPTNVEPQANGEDVPF